MVIKWQWYRINPQTVKQHSGKLCKYRKTSTFLEIYVHFSFLYCVLSQVGKLRLHAVVIVCQQFSQPEHVSSTEDHIKL